jgi:hypothetical protein
MDNFFLPDEFAHRFARGICLIEAGGAVNRHRDASLLRIGPAIRAASGLSPTRTVVPLLASCLLSGCSAAGAPSFDLFGAFFPAWLLCGVLGVFGAGAARGLFVMSGLWDRLPYQLFVCTAVGVLVACLLWLLEFGW